MIGVNGVTQTRIELATHDTDLKADVGDFSGQTHLQTLLAALGIPDTDSKPLYTCLITDRLDDATFGLDALHTDIAAIPTAMVGTDNAFLAAVGGALADAAAAGDPTEADTLMKYVKQLVNVLVGGDGVAAWSGAAVPGNGVSIHEVIEKIYTDAAAVLLSTDTNGVILGTKVAAFKKLVGESQIAITTEDLNQAADTYDLFLGTTKPVLLKSFSIKQPTTVTAGDLTSISIVTDDATPQVIINTTDGAVGNLLTESEISWTGAVRIETGTKIQLIIAGGATGVEQITKIVAEYVAIEDTGYLAPQEA